MEDVYWAILTSSIGLLLPLLTLRVIFDYARIFLFGGDN